MEQIANGIRQVKAEAGPRCGGQEIVEAEFLEDAEIQPVHLHIGLAD